MIVALEDKDSTPLFQTKELNYMNNSVDTVRFEKTNLKQFETAWHLGQYLLITMQYQM